MLFRQMANSGLVWESCHICPLPVRSSVLVLEDRFFSSDLYGAFPQLWNKIYVHIFGSALWDFFRY